jgi:CDP-glucose 4,6-dehydratase
MEEMVNGKAALFGDKYRSKRVLITGHTGFKGSWLALWLVQLGAEVIGYSLPPPTSPNHFDHLHLDIVSIEGDIRDKERLEKTVREHRPEIVFHLAAQSLVRQSYREPVDTFTSNSLGTINVLEACRSAESTRAMIIVTSDKCYENREWVWGYRESDPVGGYDPYSASKGCAEIIVACWRNSYFNLQDYGSRHQALLSTVRAGNVIGGGDWAPDRIIPDLMRAASNRETVLMRNPNAVRPWQHVLEPLSGYLLLGQKLLEGRLEFSGPWNFGPSDRSTITVRQLAESAQTVWPRVRYKIQDTLHSPHESRYLRLDSAKAQSELKWKPLWDLDKTVSRTVGWYKSFCERGEINTPDDLQSFITEARSRRSEWAAG